MFRGALVGDPLPDLAVRQWLVRNPALDAPRSRQVKVILFWNSQDPASREALAFVDSLAGALPADRFAAVTIHTEVGSDDFQRVDEIRGFIAERGLDIPVGVDNENACLHRCGLPDIPAFLIVDSRGVVRGVVENYRPSGRPKIAAFVSDLLGRG